MSLSLRPSTKHEANAYIKEYHRHHGMVQGCLFCLAACDGDKLVGVVVVGRPVARMLQNGRTAEVTRLCTDGTRNAASFLLGHARRASQAMGYTKIITYTLPEEGGASLRGAGFKCAGEAGGGSWSRKGRERTDAHPLQLKLRWEA